MCFAISSCNIIPYCLTEYPNMSSNSYSENVETVLTRRPECLCKPQTWFMWGSQTTVTRLIDRYLLRHIYAQAYTHTTIKLPNISIHEQLINAIWYWPIIDLVRAAIIAVQETDVARCWRRHECECELVGEEHFPSKGVCREEEFVFQIEGHQVRVWDGVQYEPSLVVAIVVAHLRRFRQHILDLSAKTMSFYFTVSY